MSGDRAYDADDRMTRFLVVLRRALLLIVRWIEDELGMRQ